MSELTSKELLPCPFCGFDKAVADQDVFGEWAVYCPTVGGCGMGTGHSPVRAVVVSAWNKRAAPEPLDELAQRTEYICARHDHTAVGIPCPDCRPSPPPDPSYVCVVQPHQDRLVIDGFYYHVDAIKRALGPAPEIAPDIKRCRCGEPLQPFAGCPICDRPALTKFASPK